MVVSGVHNIAIITSQELHPCTSWSCCNCAKLSPTIFGSSEPFEAENYFNPPISFHSHTHTHTHTQNIIQENPFTDTLRTGSASPTLSIGEAIDGPEKMISNPFLPDQAGGPQAQQWEMYKQQVREKSKRERERRLSKNFIGVQMVTQMQLMQEQLKQEKTARIESQVSLAH